MTQPRPATGLEIPHEMELFNKSWAILKNYAHISQSDSGAWEMLVNEVNELNIHAPADIKKLTNQVTIAILDHLEARSKREALNGV